MTSKRSIAALLLGMALAGGVLATDPGSAAPMPAEGVGGVPAIFDPTEMARYLCRTGEQRDDLFERRLQLASAAGAPASRETSAGADAVPPLFDGLGDRSIPADTDRPLAQAYFDQGLRWIFGFNHAEAVRAFRYAQQLDPGCGLCFWGEALALGPNINQPMVQEAAAPAYEAAQAALARSADASPRERALIAAIARRYGPPGEGDRALLDRAYAEAMEDAHGQFPDDRDIAVLFAEALMTLQPWDYWEADRTTPRGRAGEAIAVLEGVLAEDPDHPAAIHLYIHIVEASADPERAEPYADRLVGQMPGAGHIVHMPSHLYYRIGRYADSLEANVRAVAADRAYLAESPIGGIYQYGYYPHNIHFVVTSAGMAGDAETAYAHADMLAEAIPAEVARRSGWVQVILAAPYFNHTLFGDDADILEVPPPQAGMPYVRAMWHYMRAVAYARQADVQGAVVEARAIDRIGRDNDFAGLIAAGVPAPDLLRLALHVVEGRLARARGETARAIDAFDRAVEIQDRLPYMEPPYWYYPVRQSLGAALLAAGLAEEAEAVFWQSLLNHPNNGWALFGLAAAHRAQGETRAAAYAEILLDRAWLGDVRQLSIDRL